MKIIKILLGLVILIFISLNVDAFGVASPFAGNGPVFVPPGESKDITFSVQNGAGATEDVVAKLEVLEGKEIIELIEETEYLVPAGGAKSATIRIKVPENAREDDSWNVRLSFKVTPSAKSSAVDMGYGVITSFDVVTVPPIKPTIPTGEVVKEKEQSSNLPLALAVVVIAGIIIYFVQRKSKPQKK